MGIAVTIIAKILESKATAAINAAAERQEARLRELADAIKDLTAEVRGVNERLDTALPEPRSGSE